MASTEIQELDTTTLESLTLLEIHTWNTADDTPGSDTKGSNTYGILNAGLSSLVTLGTLLGQIMVLMVVSRDKRLCTPMNYFFISLAIADLLISIISMPTWILFSTLG